MKIELKADATSGNVVVPKGEYLVGLSSENQQINLTGGGKDYQIPAVKRRSTMSTRVTTISFYSGGGRLWSLIVKTPKHGEWIAMFEYQGTSKKA